MENIDFNIQKLTLYELLDRAQNNLTDKEFNQIINFGKLTTSEKLNLIIKRNNSQPDFKIEKFNLIKEISNYIENEFIKQKP